MPRAEPFRDFYLYRDRFAFYHTTQFFSFDGPAYLYPAPPAIFYKLFFLFPHPTETFLGVLAAVFVAMLFIVTRLLISRGVAVRNATGFVVVPALCSYPFFFEFEQANLEWIVCVFVCAGLWAFLRGRGYTAAACFGFAASMKIFPILFLGLLLARRQYRQAAATLAVAAVSTVVSLWLLCPDIRLAWHGTQDGVAIFRRYYMLRYEQVGFDHSLFAAGKALSLVLFVHHLQPPMLSLLLNLYLVIIAFAGVILFFDRIRHLPVVNQILCLTICSILLPPVSYDYTLAHLYAPWLLLVLLAVQARSQTTPGLSAVLVCFAILFAPETEFIARGHSFGGQIKAAAMLVLLGIALVRRFPSTWDEAAIAA